MAQTRNYQAEDGIWLEGINDKCLICGEKKEYRIFYQLQNGKYYVCKDCENTIQGLFIDIILERSIEQGTSIDKVINDFSVKVHNLIETREKHKMYKYYIDGGILDDFDLYYSLEEICDKYPKRKNEFIIKEGQINRIMQKEVGEKPHTIKFFALPNFNDCSMDIYAVAKIWNNGTTFMFGDNSVILDAFGSTYDHTSIEMK